MSIMKAVILDGVVIHIGEWDYLTEDDICNPLPDRAVQGEFDISKTANGNYVLTSNYAELRKQEYPSIGDQLDALFKAGLFPPEMAEKIQNIKDKYPKNI